jgi:RNA polymerase sigma-70 factor (ECF subfamily)
MLRLAAGDDSVFERIVSSFERQVYGIIYRYIRDRAQAEDCAQEVFLRVFKMRKSYTPTARLSTLIYRITTNLCLNAIRDERRRQMTSLDAPYGEDEAPLSAALVSERMPAADAEITARERAEAVHRALLRIPDRQRIALILHRFEGLSYADIAEAMETNVDAVKALLSRGRQSLAEALRKDLEAGNL